MKHITREEAKNNVKTVLGIKDKSRTETYDRIMDEIYELIEKSSLRGLDFCRYYFDNDEEKEIIDDIILTLKDDGFGYGIDYNLKKLDVRWK